MKNIYLALIVGFVLHLTTVPNRKLYSAVLCEFFRLVPTFLLFLSNNFPFSLSSFLKPLPNLHEVIAALQLVLKSLMVLSTLDLSYYTPAETTATNEAIAIAMPEFLAKVTDNENKHLRHHAICLIDNLELLQSLYLIENNLMSIASVMKSLEQARAIGE